MKTFITSIFTFLLGSLIFSQWGYRNGFKNGSSGQILEILNNTEVLECKDGCLILAYRDFLVSYKGNIQDTLPLIESPSWLDPK